MSYKTYDFVLQNKHFHCTSYENGCMRNESIWMENQYFDNLPLDSSRQVGDQFLISGSPQTRFGRIGEWASGNLQPCSPGQFF